MAETKKELTKEIVESYGVLSTSSSGWTKELNKVSWNGKDAKYDLREWDPTHEKVGKGVTLTEEEFQELKNIISNM